MSKIIIAFLTVAFAAADVFAESSAKLEAEAKKMAGAEKLDKMRELYAQAGEQRLKEASLYRISSEKDSSKVELSLEDESSDEDILQVSEQDTIDAAARNFIAAARDFELGAKPRRYQAALELAKGVKGCSQKVVEELDELVRWVAKRNDATERDFPPDVKPENKGMQKLNKMLADVQEAVKSGNFNSRQIAGMWSKIGYESFLKFRIDIMRKALAEIKRLKMKPGHYAHIWVSGIDTYDKFAKFPLEEKDTKAPLTLKDMGVEEGATVIAGQLDWDPEDATKCVQEALDTPGVTTIIIENRGSPWYIRTIRPRSNQRILLKKGVVMLQDKVSRQLKSKGDMIYVSGAKNVIIEGEGGPGDVYIGKFRSLKERNRYSNDYGGSGITISGARNVVVRNITFGANTCDGVTLTGLGAVTRDIWLENLILTDNYRQAMSVCSVFGLYCRNVSFLNTIGGDPMSGIDFEPTYETEANSDMYFYDCKFGGNAGSATVFSSSSFYPVTANFKRCYFGVVPNCYQIIIFPRCGVYMGNNVKAPSNIIFDECTVESHPDTYPVKLDNSALFDVQFKNCHFTALTNRYGRKYANAPVTFDLSREYRYSGNWKYFSPENNGKLKFDNIKVTGFREPFIEVRDRTGGYSVETLSGSAEINGKKVDVSTFNYKAPEIKMNLKELEKFDPSKYLPFSSDANVDTADIQPQEFSLSWKHEWFNGEPRYRAVYFDEGVWKMKLIQTGVSELGLEGKPVAFTARTTYGSTFKLSPKIRKKPYTFYFEVPPGGRACTFKIIWGLGTLRNAEGEVVRKFEWSGCSTSQYQTCRPKSDKSEIWSFTAESGITMRFFHPFSGFIAEKPEYLPRRMPGTIK